MEIFSDWFVEFPPPVLVPLYASVHVVFYHKTCLCRDLNQNLDPLKDILQLFSPPKTSKHPSDISIRAYVFLVFINMLKHLPIESVE